MNKNHWELFEKPGWQGISDMLDQALEKTLKNIDLCFHGGTDRYNMVITGAWVTMVQRLDENSFFGAGNSEGRQYLANRLQNHLRKYFKFIHIDRWGGFSV